MITLFSIVGALAFCATIVILTGIYYNSPTKGAPIEQYDNPKSALLVVDVQKDITNDSSPYDNIEGFVYNVNQAITHAEKNDMEIIYIKNECGNNPIIKLLSGGKFKEGTEGVEFDSNLLVLNDNIFIKNKGDSFSIKEFDEYLISNQVDTLYIVGADASACVYNTARGALNRDYVVSVIEDAIITVNDKTMSKMLKQYEKDGIEVTNMV